MELSRELQTYTNDEKTTYVAPESSVIAIVVSLHESERGAVSPLFLLNEPDFSSTSWSEWQGTEVILQLGRYLHAEELEKIQNEIRDFLNNSELTDEEVATEIRNIKESITVEFDAPSEPYEVFSEDPRLEKIIHPDTPDKQIAIFASEAAEQTIPYMHPWEAYQFLVDLQDNWPTEC